MTQDYLTKNLSTISVICILALTALFGSQSINLINAETAGCQFPLAVSDEAQLNVAIDCYNQAPVGDYTINITANIELTGNTAEIDNTSGSTLTIDGNNFEINGNRLGRILNVQNGDVTITSLNMQRGRTTDTVICRDKPVIQATLRCGGGLYVGATATVTLNASIINDSIANDHGGGIANEGNLTIIDSTISNNFTQNSSGGGILNRGTLIVNNSVVADNSSQGTGGGILSAGGILKIDNSTFSNNSTFSTGVAIANTDAAESSITNSTFTNNLGGYDNGALYNDSATLMTISSSVIINNPLNVPPSSDDGGAVLNYGLMEIYDTSITGNWDLNLDGTITGSGRGIYNVGEMEIVNSNISRNKTSHDGGGIYNEGTISITNGTIDQNSADNGGGGIYSIGPVTIESSNISNNQSGFGGGGVQTDSTTAILNNSTVSDNSANGGGGWKNTNGSIIISNSTFSDNFASVGGALSNSTSGKVTINSSTIYARWNFFGLGVGPAIFTTSSEPVSIHNSIVVKVNGGDACFGDIVSDETSLNNDGSCNDGTVNTLTDINLGPLLDNGGSTKTHALLPGSVAIDAATADPDVTTDQRGVARPQGGAPDVGAFEFVDENTKGEITIVVDTTPFNSGVDFRFGGDLGSFRLDNAGGNDGDTFTNSQTFTVDPGNYKIKEIEYSRWVLLDITCSGGDTSIDLANLEIVADIEVDEHITCTFLNERAAFINARKVDDVNGSGNYQSGEPFMADWEIEVYDSDNQFVTSELTDTDGRVSIKVKAGDYTVCEVPQDGWSATRPTQVNQTFGQPCYSVSLLPKRIGWMRFFNTQSLARAMAPADDGHGADVIYTWADEPEDESTAVDPFANNPFAENKTKTIYLPIIKR